MQINLNFDFRNEFWVNRLYYLKGDANIEIRIICHSGQKVELDLSRNQTWVHFSVLSSGLSRPALEP